MANTKPRAGTPAFGRQAAKRKRAILQSMTPAERKKAFGDLHVTDIVSGKKTSLRERKREIEKAGRH
jgi:hypothetical protein